MLHIKWNQVIWFYAFNLFVKFILYECMFTKKTKTKEIIETEIMCVEQNITVDCIRFLVSLLRKILSLQLIWIVIEQLETCYIVSLLQISHRKNLQFIFKSTYECDLIASISFKVLCQNKYCILQIFSYIIRDWLHTT